ncbi:MAG: 1-acyl-sn-glycerol-3-phosphate acyltransferase [Spirochaetes bacterium]|jgi:glycerol-3-phosphate O-acyltransferase|nr:1-acyl-sn-glycerol-3-phosphate acyltransferase [Spirochaetota bacterium]
MKSQLDTLLSGLLVERLSGFKYILAAYLCRKADLDDESVKIIRDYSQKGKLVYVSFQSSNIALMMLYRLLEKNDLARPRLALECKPFLLQSFSHLFKRFFGKIRHLFKRKNESVFCTEFVENEFSESRPILFSMLADDYFLKRYVEQKYDTLYYLIEMQKNSEEPFFLMPQTVFWTRKPDKSGRGDKTFRSSSDKGFFSAFLSAATPSYVHMITPLNLKEYIAEHEGKSSEEIAHSIRDSLIEEQQKEDRVVLGPVLAPKNEMMERVLNHRNVREAIDRISQEDNRSKKRLRKKAYSYYREIAADFSITYIRFFGIILNWIFRKIFSGFIIDEEFIPVIKEAAKAGPVVLVPCHRSHMDSLILSYAFFQKRVIPPHIAAGVNLSFFPIGSVFRHSGAFFIRRTFKNLKLYPEVFKQYLKTLLLDRYQLEFFIEGGRTRTGRLLYPRPGLLSYIIEAADQGYAGDVTFVPISINYDRVLEEGAYFREINGKDKQRENFRSILSGWKVLKKDYGYVYVNAGKPFTLNGIRNGSTVSELVPKIGNRIVTEIAKAVTISPVAFVTLAMLLYRKKGVSHDDLLRSANYVFSVIKALNIRCSDVFTSKSITAIIEQVMDSYSKDSIITKVEDADTADLLYTITDDNRRLIAFYKNSIAHHFLPLFSMANIFCRVEDSRISRNDFNSSLTELITLLKYEYVLPEDNEEAIGVQVDLLLNDFFVANRFVQVEGDIIIINDQAWVCDDLKLLATGVEDILESYYCAVHSIEKIKKKSMEINAFTKVLAEHGKALFVTGRLSIVESISVPVFKNSMRLLSERGIVSEKSVSKRKTMIEILDKDKAVLFKKEIARLMVQ